MTGEMASAVETPDATYSAKRFRRADSTMPEFCAAVKRWEARGSQWKTHCRTAFR